jgi:NAD(P)-dependent dehydrogenase (short-subunit alcohol dehydrogenase family)
VVSIAGLAALVTGGGSGIGLASAARLASDGAHVTICGRTEEKLAKAGAEISSVVGDVGSIRSIVADVTSEDQVAAAVAFAAEPTGGLDILFANAGGSLHMGPFESADLIGVRATIDLNLTGTMICIKHAVPAMKRSGGGSIIGMSSGAGHFPHRSLWAYGASKAGIEHACRYAAAPTTPCCSSNPVVLASTTGRCVP